MLPRQMLNIKIQTSKKQDEKKKKKKLDKQKLGTNYKLIKCGSSLPKIN